MDETAPARDSSAPPADDVPSSGERAREASVDEAEEPERAERVDAPEDGAAAGVLAGADALAGDGGEADVSAEPGSDAAGASTVVAAVGGEDVGDEPGEDAAGEAIVLEGSGTARREDTTQQHLTPYKPNAFMRWIYRRFFSHIQVDDSWSEAVRSSARKGVVVYVMRSISFLDFLCLDYLLKRLGLPLIRFVNDLGLWILEPFGKGGRRLRFKRQRPEQDQLAKAVSEHHSALLFLRRPPRIGSAARKGEELDEDLIRTLVETQRKMAQPILLQPQTIVWTKLPPKRKRGLVDLFFGPVEWPGRVRVFFQFLFNYKNALLRSGEPFDLQAFMARHQELTDEEMADKVRYALLRRMERERTLVLGPTKKTAGRIREELVRSPRLREGIESTARAEKKSVAKVERYVHKELRRLQADQKPYMLAFLGKLLQWVFSRIYDGLVVDAEGVERVRDAAREGTLIYLPSHKSHVDYLVLSKVLYDHALSPPLIAAGENLSFFPLGPILRRGGAFFIRRSFKGKKLYAALVDAYMRKLMVEGFPIEFFIEGGRSRTGKLLAPKYGLLSMVIDAAMKLRMKKVFFVPISIGYERIIEERSYVHELGGGEKQKENVGGLLKTPKVLRSKYGRLYVQFGAILSFEELLGEVLRGEHLEPEKRRAIHSEARDRGSIKPPERRALVQRIAHRTTYEINRVTVVTPAALVASALLVHRRRGITRADLMARCEMIHEALVRFGARVAAPIVAEDGVSMREDTLDEAIALFLDAGLIRRAEPGGEPIYRVQKERRLALEYYKNNVVHFFVPSALIGASLLAGEEEESVSLHALRERVRQLSRLFKYEFMYRADARFDAIFDDAIDGMCQVGELERMAEHVRVAEGPKGRQVQVYASMLTTYFESYLLAVRGCRQLLSHESPRERKEWVKRTLSLGQRMYLAGELELRESVSKLKLETALKSLKDHGLLKYEADEKVRLADDTTDELLGDLEEKLAAFLR